MEQLSAALILAARAHDGQTDKGGQPYILHSIRVALKVNSLEHKIVALLHDILEDTEVTEDDLLASGFTRDTVDAVVCLTKEKGEDYMAFIERCKENQIARFVKLADLEDNLDLSRIPAPTAKDKARVQKYKKAMNKLLY